MTDTLQDAAWGNEPFHAIRLAGDKARLMKRAGNVRGAHTKMLSAYIGSMGQVRDDPAYGRVSTNLHLLHWFLKGRRHANALRKRIICLNHKQLNVLATWYEGTGRKLRWLIPLAQAYAFTALMAATALGRQAAVSPHDTALAHMLYARSLMLDRERSPATNKEVEHHIERALALREEIRAEADQPQGLRQLVRVLKDAVEMRALLEYPREGMRSLLAEARDLANGEADTPSQASAVEALAFRLGLLPLEA